MAYFIVIGTSNDVQKVVDGIKQSHLQHNVVTSGCILNKEQGTFYHWDVFNANGEKTEENNNNEPIDLRDALTNQISQFKTLMPENAIPNVFIVSSCLNDTDTENLQMVCEELYEIGGTTQCGLQTDIVIIGYDLQNHTDVTKRPHWQLLKSLRGLGCCDRFPTNVLYINNMDYKGAATNVDSKLLSRFLCHWSKMVCSDGYSPKAIVNDKVYSIGISEHQYDFRDLNEFFKLAAEEKLLDRTLNGEPSPATKNLLDTHYFGTVKLEYEWIDGLKSIQSIWNSYCSTEWNPSTPLSGQPYSVSCQEQELASYLNQYLNLYIDQEERIIADLNDKLLKKKTELEHLLAKQEQVEISDTATETDERKIAQLQNEISNCEKQIRIHKDNIERNTFIDANQFHDNFGFTQPITEQDQKDYSDNYAKVGGLINYVKSDEGVRTMREAIGRATNEDELPHSVPVMAIENVGWVEPRIVEDSSSIASSEVLVQEPVITEDKSEKSGCLTWFFGLFKKQREEIEQSKSTLETPLVDNAPIDEATSKSLVVNMNNSVAALKKVDDVRKWWDDLCRKIEKYQMRKDECVLLMDGERMPDGRYVKGKEGYRPSYHIKSTSLIDMERVRAFRDGHEYYKQMLDRFLHRWFDNTATERMTMLELIKHQVLDPLVGKYHTLKWDGSNPFVKEEMTDYELHDCIEHDIRQSKPFVEYVNIQNFNISQDITVGFFSNNQNIPSSAPEFRNRYTLSSDTIIPTHISDFVNSLCVVQVMSIPNHIDTLKDYKPKRTAELSRLNTNITQETISIISHVETIEDKARAIYDWLCENIAYDTTKQIHDAETCWRTKRGVCQAYCELFCYMAEIAGLTADIFVGKVKTPDGKISEDKHSWIFVYTHEYEGILIDPTWGAGAVNGNKYVKNTDNSMWFDVSPYWMVFTHFPEQQDCTRLNKLEITEEQFKQLPYKLPTNDTDGKDFLFESLPEISKE